MLRGGEAVDVRFTTWGGARHWEFTLRVLGVDGHAAAWAASFYDSPDQPIATYVDMTTVPEWTGTTVTMVDLDLDVILDRDGSLMVDDEDEFAAHRVQLGYPDDVVALARRTADEVLAAVADGAEPFGSVGAGWLAASARAAEEVNPCAGSGGRSAGRASP